MTDQLDAAITLAEAAFARLSAENQQLRAQLAEQARTLETLKDALVPFAETWRAMVKDEDRQPPVQHICDRLNLTHFEAASNALKSQKP